MSTELKYSLFTTCCALLVIVAFSFTAAMH
ncbi:MAG: hypothetical protein XXXJIFNMEKO3_01585 [Candidatus Erwinia impunctatus]|nr:hypothetical protein XXXJIFNMEKO_01585 [Culicoides impunctatus]